MNSNRHNLSGGRIILLSTEDPEEYLEHIDEYLNRFQPIDGVERDLVNRLIAASWREKRIDCMEAALIELEINTQAPSIEKEFEIIDGVTRHTLAMLGTSDQREAANLLLRYQSAARRSYGSALRALKELQGDRFNRQPAPSPAPAPPSQPESQPNTPEPASPKIIPFLRRTVEICKLPNEPERAQAAGHGSFSAASQTGFPQLANISS